MEHTLATHSNLLAYWEGSEGNIVDDTYGEVVLRHWQCEVLVNSEDLCWSGIVRTETIATTYYEDIAKTELLECILNIEIERFAVSAWLFGAVKHADTFNRSWKSLLEVFEREWTVEMNIDHTELVALLCLVVDNLLDSLASRTHTDDDVLCVRCTIVGEWAVGTASNLRDLVHIVAYDVCYLVVVRVAALAVSEEHIWVLSHTTHNRAHRRECTIAELLERLHINEWAQVFHIYYLYFLVLVRGTETVEEVEEWHAALDSSQVSYTSEVHDLLYAALSEHSETGLTARHHVLMVAEDTKSVRSQCTSRHVEYRRYQLTCDLVHIRDHQEQTLASGEGSGEGTCVECAVHSTCSTCLRLHLLYQHCLAEEVLATCSSPLIHVLRHWR